MHLPLDTQEKTVGYCCAVYTRDRCIAIMSTRFAKSLCFGYLINCPRYIKEDDLQIDRHCCISVSGVDVPHQVFVTFVQQFKC